MVVTSSFVDNNASAHLARGDEIVICIVDNIIELCALRKFSVTKFT